MLHDKIYQDYVSAMKAKDKFKVEFLSFVRGHLQNKSIELKKEKLDDNEVLAVLTKQKKQLEDAKSQMESSGRPEMIDKTEKELLVIGEYFPEAMSEQEVLEIIEKVISESGASSMKDMGAVMKEVLAKVGARADSKIVSSIVKDKLA